MTSMLLFILVIFVELCFAKAPPRTGQPYAESICENDPNIIFCEDFNYPSNFWYSGNFEGSNVKWINPGLASQVYGFVPNGIKGRRINPAVNYPAKPIGRSTPAGSSDYVWAANWDASKGDQGDATTAGLLRNPGGNYMNGSSPAKDFYIRFQYYVTGNYSWPGDPKTDRYGFNISSPYDNKILFFYPPETFAPDKIAGQTSPTYASYDAGLFTGVLFDPGENARFTDAMGVRIGNTSHNYKFFPNCPESQCTTYSQYNYGSFQNSVLLRNPNDQPIYKKPFRFNTNKWYTLEVHCKLSSVADAFDGAIQVWVDNTLIYDESGLQTCGSVESSKNGVAGGPGVHGDCSGLGAVNLVAYHNGLDTTEWNGQQVIDNLVISKSRIGQPELSGGTSIPLVPAAPKNLNVN